MAAPVSPKGNKVTASLAVLYEGTRGMNTAVTTLSHCFLFSRHWHRTFGAATTLISIRHCSALCISVCWGRNWICFSSGRLQREMREREEGAIGKAETNYNSSDESHLDCREAKNLPRWLPVKHALSKHPSFLPARPPPALPSPTSYRIGSTESDKIITFLMTAKKSQTVDNSREKGF